MEAKKKEDFINRAAIIAYRHALDLMEIWQPDIDKWRQFIHKAIDKLEISDDK